MSKHNRMRRKSDHLKKFEALIEKDGKHHKHNTSNVGSHMERTKDREQQKLMGRHFGNER